MSAGTVRILHVVGGMGMGGVETWLMHVVRRIDRKHFRMDFLVHGDEKREYDEELEKLGCRIVRCPPPIRPLSYARAFLRVLRESGPYDVVHTHLHYFSGVPLFLARLGGVPSRFVHSHSDARGDAREAGVTRRAYRKLMRALIAGNATRGFAASQRAAEDLFGFGWPRDDRFEVLQYALDLSAGSELVDGAAIRRQLGFPHEALIAGHVGRFAPEKNHAWLLQILVQMARKDARVHALLVGDGPLRPKIEEQARALGLNGRIVFTGVRRDVARLLRGAMDVLIFPSIFEGLPLTVIEAQAAGLPCLISTAISPEVVQSQLISWLSLEESPSAWADLALELALRERAAPPSTDQWPSDLRTSLRTLEDCYRSAVMQ